MSLPALTRNLLWERSGNQCVLCKKELAKSICAFSGSRSFGTLCQIISEERESPRYEYLKKYDFYDNYILLCSDCRNEINERCENYSAPYLKTLRGVHEAWLRTAIAEEKRKAEEEKKKAAEYEESLKILHPITTGAQLYEIVREVSDCEFEHCEPTSQEDTYISELLQFIPDRRRENNTGDNINMYSLVVKLLEKRGFLL
jgi:hypothetical protein